MNVRRATNQVPPLPGVVSEVWDYLGADGEAGLGYGEDFWDVGGRRGRDMVDGVEEEGAGDGFAPVLEAALEVEG